MEAVDEDTDAQVKGVSTGTKVAQLVARVGRKKGHERLAQDEDDPEEEGVDTGSPSRFDIASTKLPN